MVILKVPIRCNITTLFILILQIFLFIIFEIVIKHSLKNLIDNENDDTYLDFLCLHQHALTITSADRIPV